jgi:hypothetical protein
MCTYFIMSYYVFIFCESESSRCYVVNSIFIFFAQSASTFIFLFQNIFIELVCTNCLVLSCDYCTFCFSASVSRVQTSVRLFPLSIFSPFYVEIVHADFSFTPFLQVPTKLRGRVVNTPSYSEGPEFHSRPWLPAILIEVFCGFPQSLQANAFKLCHIPFLPNPFQFIIYLSTYHRRYIM